MQSKIEIRMRNSIGKKYNKNLNNNKCEILSQEQHCLPGDNTELQIWGWINEILLYFLDKYGNNIMEYKN